MTVFSNENLVEAIRLMDAGHPVTIIKMCRDTVLQGRDLTMSSKDFEAYLNFAISVRSIDMKTGGSKDTAKKNFFAICDMKEDVKASDMPKKSREIYFQSLPILQNLQSPPETEFAQRMLSGLNAALESNFSSYTGKFTNPMAKGDVLLLGMSDEKRGKLKSIGLSSRTFNDKKIAWAGDAAYLNYANFLMTTINGKSVLERLAIGGEEDFIAYVLTRILGDLDIEKKCRDILAQEGIGDTIS